MDESAAHCRTSFLGTQLGPTFGGPGPPAHGSKLRAGGPGISAMEDMPMPAKPRDFSGNISGIVARDFDQAASELVAQASYIKELQSRIASQKELIDQQAARITALEALWDDEPA